VTQTLNGTPGNDILTGTDPGNPANPDGIDIINGLDGNDTLTGLGGDDTISGGLGTDVLDGGAGWDTLTFANATAGVWVNLNAGGFSGEAVGDTMTGFEAMIGSAFNDIFGGDGGNNTINGGAGTDIIAISGGTDFLDGGADGDYLDCRGAASAVTINVATGIGSGGAAGTTFANFENIIATGFNDILIAAAAGSTLGGLGGNDTITGGDGNDVLLGDDFLNIIGTTGNDTLSGGAGNDYLQGGALGDILNGGADSDTAGYENSNAGVIVNVDTGAVSGGHAQGDTLISIENVIGSIFDDLFGASAAVNFFDGRAGGDGVTYIASTAGVLVNLNGGVGQGGWAQGDTFANMEYAAGSNFDDTLYGNAANNSLDGGEGNDVLEGLVGADTLQGGNGSDTAAYVFSAAGVTADLKAGFFSGGDAQGDVLLSIENLTGSAFADTLRGDNGANVIDGGDGDDAIAGYGGADAINGGAGIDTVYYDVAAVTVNLTTGQGSGGDAQADTYQNVENVVGTAANDTLVGNAGSNRLDGGAGDDTIAGEAGADTLIGGAGIDTAWYNNSAVGVLVDLRSGTGAGGDAQGDTLSGIENLAGSNFNDTLIGDVGSNQLDGGVGDDTIAGEAGADTLIGGAGIDAAWYNNSAVGVLVNLMTGTGAGGDAQGDTLNGIENLVGSAFNDTLDGDTGANALTGADGDDILRSYAGNDVVSGGNGNDLINAGSGADAIDGGAGIDTVYYDSSTVGVTVNLATGTGAGGDAQGDTLTGIENLAGSGFNDKLYGSAVANALTGGDGDDVLRGGAGADVLNGGNGLDQANYQGSAAAVSVDLLAHTASGGDAAGDTLTGIENLYGSSNADQLTGDNARNVIGGELGNDTLAGNGGDDSLSGEGGNDNLSGGDGADRLVGGDGIDTIHGGIGNDSVDAGSENDQVFGEAGNDSLYGGAGADSLDGGDGNDTLEGAAGADTLTGGAGIDTASYAGSAAGVSVNLATGVVSGGDAAGDTFSSIEQVLGSALADTLTGNANANTLWGMGGGDVLTGGGGGDALKGGAGNDRFVYTALSDSAVSGIGKDGITDFSTGDKIDLSAIDADGNSGNGDTAFTFGTGDYTRHAGELRVVTSGSVQVVYVDVNGDKVSDFAINVTADHGLMASDFVL
jgi:Ca2+-binding RTX toxin-like protein